MLNSCGIGSGRLSRTLRMAPHHLHPQPPRALHPPRTTRRLTRSGGKPAAAPPPLTRAAPRFLATASREATRSSPADWLPETQATMVRPQPADVPATPALSRAAVPRALRTTHPEASRGMRGTMILTLAWKRRGSNSRKERTGNQTHARCESPARHGPPGRISSATIGRGLAPPATFARGRSVQLARRGPDPA